jgi:hypothetical protein
VIHSLELLSKKCLSCPRFAPEIPYKIAPFLPLILYGTQTRQIRNYGTMLQGLPEQQRL